ncbi:MAG: polyprenyl synthetase family protein, partial [Ardenticatenaceae bacterium]
PILTCIAAGGDAARAIPLAASWFLYDLASNIFDDLQDSDDHSLPWSSWGPGRAINVGLGTLAAAQLCLSLIKAAPKTQTEIQQAMARTFLLAARGQGLPEEEPLLAWYFEHILAKSGLVFATVAWAGARIHSQDTEQLKMMHDFGLALGALIQLGDDCYDLIPRQASGDLSLGQFTLPMIYGLSQRERPQHARLAALLRADRAMTPEEIEEARQILVDMSAIPFSLSVAKVYEQKALAALDACCLEDSIYLRNYVSQLLPPFPKP